MKLKILFCLPWLLGGCAHDLTASEHRAEAARHQEIADAQRAQPDRTDNLYAAGPRSPFSDEAATLRPYNPSAARINEADRQMRESFEHLQAAQQLEKFEDAACAGISAAERIGCPLLAPHTSWVEETGEGLRVHLKPDAPAQRLAAQLQCHLAFSQARGFDRAPCPLYVKGVKITLEDNAIDFRSANAQVASQVRLEGRKLFGEPNTIQK